MKYVLMAVAFLFTGNVAIATNNWHETPEQEWKVSVTGEWSECIPNEGNECGKGGGTQNRTITYVKTKFECPEGYSNNKLNIKHESEKECVKVSRERPYIFYSSKTEVITDTKQEDEVRECETEAIMCPVPEPTPTPEEPKDEKSNNREKCTTPGAPGAFRYDGGIQGDGKITLKWIPKKGVKNVDISVYDADKTTSVRKLRTKDDGEYTVTGLANHAYWFKMRAMNSCGFGTWTKKIDPKP